VIDSTIASSLSGRTWLDSSSIFDCCRNFLCYNLRRLSTLMSLEAPLPNDGALPLPSLPAAATCHRVQGGVITMHGPQL
jgi:hypothetical protein